MDKMIFGVYQNPIHKGQTWVMPLYGDYMNPYFYAGGLYLVELVAVWKIKPSDLPIEGRLAMRIGLVGGWCSIGGYKQLNDMFREFVVPKIEELRKSIDERIAFDNPF